MADVAYSVAPVNAPAAESAALVLELAQALHKRAIYPADHPTLTAAVAAFAARTMRKLALGGPLVIGVARSQLVIDGVSTDDGHPLLSELAAHLHAHHLAGIQMLPGATVEELKDLVAFVATPVDRAETPLGLLPDAELLRWQHVSLIRTRFERLEMAGEEAAPKLDANPLWLDLARSALQIDGMSNEDFSPTRVARALHERLQNGDEVEGRRVADAFLQLTAAATGRVMDTTGSPSRALRRDISELVRALQPDTLRRLLRMAGDDERRMRLISHAVDAMPVGAVVDIVTAGASEGGQVVAGSIVRLLGKLARHAGSPLASETGTDRQLRKQVKQLLANWTLDDPNPDGYAQMLRDLGSTGGGAGGTDRHLDECEPERLLDICLESGTFGPSAELALSRLVRRDGLAAVLDRLATAPWSETREAAIDSLVNGSVLKEQLAAERPDLRVLEHAVERLRERAVEPLLDALQTHGPGDATWVAHLLLRIGDYCVPLLSKRLITLSPPAQRVLLSVFDQLGAWPDVTDLRALCRHGDSALRREALRLMIKNDETRMDALVLGARDPDEHILAMVVSTAVRGCSDRVASILIERLDDGEELSEELRARAARAIAISQSPEALNWLARRPLTTHWLFRFTKLRKGTPEMLACITAIAALWPEAPEAAQALRLASHSKDSEYRRAAMPKAASG